MRLVSAAERNKLLLPFSSATPCGLGSKAVFRKGFVAMVCAMRAIEDRQRRSCRRKPSRRPSTWSASVRCCSGRLLDSRLGPSVLGLLLLVCGHAWRHDVRTKFPSRVFHTPHCHPSLDESRIRGRPGWETELRRHPLGSRSELFENWVAMATAAGSV